MLDKQTDLIQMVRDKKLTGSLLMDFFFVIIKSNLFQTVRNGKLTGSFLTVNNFVVVVEIMSHFLLDDVIACGDCCVSFYHCHVSIVYGDAYNKPQNLVFLYVLGFVEFCYIHLHMLSHLFCIVHILYS